MVCSACRIAQISVAILAISAVAIAQDTTPVVLQDGATLAIRLETSINANRAKTGDSVRAVLVTPVLMHGRAVIPEGAKITGTAVEVQPLSANQASRLSLRFEAVHWKNGTAALHAYVIRHLVIKRTYEYQSRSFCPPVMQLLSPQQTQSAPQQPTKPPAQQPPTPPPAPTNPQPPQPPPRAPGHSFPGSDLCHSPTGTRRDSMQPLTFTSPAISGVTLRTLDAPDGATVLESAKKNVSLKKGMIFEIRHVAQP